MSAHFKVAIKAPFTKKPQLGKPQGKKPKTTVAPSRPPRIAVLVALAIHMEQLLRDGRLKDQAELAKLTGVTKARVRQVLRLLNLAPDLQEALLDLPLSAPQISQPLERAIRRLVHFRDWNEQRRRLLKMLAAQGLLPADYRPDPFALPRPEYCHADQSVWKSQH